MTEVPTDRLNAFIEAAHRVAEHGLVRCSSGNLSCRLDGEHMLMTASRSWMSNLTAGQVAVCRIADAACVNGLRPSVEIGLHAGVLRERPGIGVVLHFQSPFATTLACSDPSAMGYSVIIEVPYYIGPVAVVPYFPPGSGELAEAVTAAMRHHDVAMLQNHGQVTAGSDFDDAIQRAVFFELACEIIVRAGRHVRPLPEEAARALRDAADGGRAV